MKQQTKKQLRAEWYSLPNVLFRLFIKIGGFIAVLMVAFGVLKDLR